MQLGYDQCLLLGCGSHGTRTLCIVLLIQSHAEETAFKARDRLGANVCSNSIERLPCSLWLATPLKWHWHDHCMCGRVILQRSDVTKFILQLGLASIYLNHWNPTLNKHKLQWHLLQLWLSAACVCKLCMFGILQLNSPLYWVKLRRPLPHCLSPPDGMGIME